MLLAIARGKVSEGVDFGKCAFVKCHVIYLLVCLSVSVCLSVCQCITMAGLSSCLVSLTSTPRAGSSRCVCVTDQTPTLFHLLYPEHDLSYTCPIFSPAAPPQDYYQLQLIIFFGSKFAQSYGLRCGRPRTPAKTRG